MPELPEVQTIVDNLNNVINKNAMIINVEYNNTKILKNISPNMFKQKLNNKKFIMASRRGKYIILNFTDNITIVIHLRMEGKLYYEKIISNSKHCHISIKFDNEYMLNYYDTRIFGTFHLYDNDKITILNKLGIEPLTDLDKIKLAQLLKTKGNMNIKNFLLDQHIIVGIGNIYASEILYDACILPTHKCIDITNEQCVALYKSTIKILNLAIKYKGTTARSFAIDNTHSGQFQTLLKVYGRYQKPCLKCCENIAKIVQNGRSTFYCKNCQK